MNSAYIQSLANVGNGVNFMFIDGLAAKAHAEGLCHLVLGVFFIVLAGVLLVSANHWAKYLSASDAFSLTFLALCGVFLVLGGGMVFNPTTWVQISHPKEAVLAEMAQANLDDEQSRTESNKDASVASQ